MEVCVTKARHELSWNSDAKVPNGKPKGGFKSQNGFTINTGVVNQIDNEPVSPMKIFAGGALYQRKPRQDPTIDPQKTDSSPTFGTY